MNVLEYDNIHRAYERGRDVLKGISFAIDQGQVTGLLGKNGAGKTTLIRIAMGMIEPQKGTVRVFGKDPRSDALDVKRRIGYVSEDQALPPFLKVEDVIALHRGLFPTWDDDLALELSKRFDLSARARIKDLSKGQARQVALLCAISHRPELLLLDEPAGGLDPAARREFLETSIQLLNESGTTILFSSHHMSDVERMANRLVMIHEGEKWIDSDLDDVQEGYCLALVPHEAGVDCATLLGIDSCLCARDREDALHAVFESEPGRCADVLQRQLGIENARCLHIALEEMFIELVGGQS